MRRVLTALLLAFLPAAIAAAQTSTLTVEGHAMLEKPADQFRASFGVVTQNAEATAALAENSRQMKATVDALLAAGLGRDDYETGRFSVRPLYEPRPRQGVGADWRPDIIGYQVSNNVNIHTTNLDLAGKLIEAATKAGANSIDSIVFDIKDPRKHRAEAIKVATAHARADAQSLADAASLKLGRILEINLDRARPTPTPSIGMRGTVAAQMEMAPSMTPGDVTVRASVTITYEVWDREAQE